MVNDSAAEERAIVPIRRGDPLPAKAQVGEALPEDVVERCYALWCYCGRNAARTLRLYAREVEPGALVPAERTIREWARHHAWAARQDADLMETHGKTLYELQVGWLSGLKMAQNVLLDAMAGALDDLPFGGAGRIKSAEVTLRTIERAGLLAILPTAPRDAAIDWTTLTTDDKAALARQWRLERKGHGHE